MSKSKNSPVSPTWLDGWQRPEGAEPEGPTYPIIQWLNGNKGSDHPVLKTGGWELPTKWAFPILGGNYPIYNVEHDGAETADGTEPAYLFETLHVAVVMKAVAFYKGPVKNRIWSTDYVDGFYSRVRLLGFVKEIEDIAPNTPVVLTFRSSVARDFGHVTKSFRNDIINKADEIAVRLALANSQVPPQKFLPYAFWLPLTSAGKLVKTGSDQQSKYAPMQGAWDNAPFESDDQDAVIAALQSLATPPALREYVRVFYEEAKGWLKAEREWLAGQPNGGTMLVDEAAVEAGDEA